jgi:probable F420-dependent oxidoreductase
MKFSIGMPGMHRYAPMFDPWMATLRAPDYQLICRRLEAIGFDAVESSEHLALDATLVSDMGAYWPHALASIAFFAGATERLRVNTSVLILPLYHPINLAKALATLDVLSGGRVMLSVGLGHGEGEFRAMGVSYAERGKIADEYLEAMQVLWTEDRPEFVGSHVSFDGIAFDPKPVQKPYPPIWIGGNSMAALRRAVRFGAGWRPWQVSLEELPGWLQKLEAMPENARRSTPLEFHVPVARLGVGPDHKPLEGQGDGRPVELQSSELVDRIGRMEALGVTWTNLPQPRARTLEEFLDKLEAFKGLLFTAKAPNPLTDSSTRSA